MEMNDWEKAQKLSDTTSKKWARCSDCDKWKKTTNIRIIDNMNLCKRCFKKRIEEFSEPEEESDASYNTAPQPNSKEGRY